MFQSLSNFGLQFDRFSVYLPPERAHHCLDVALHLLRPVGVYLMGFVEGVKLLLDGSEGVPGVVSVVWQALRAEEGVLSAWLFRAYKLESTLVLLAQPAPLVEGGECLHALPLTHNLSINLLSID